MTIATKNNRPKMETKKELMSYLRRNKETELPFCSEVWDLAVEQTAGKVQKTKAVEVTDGYGDSKIVKMPDGVVNPVSKYFQLLALPQYKKKAEALRINNESIVVDTETEEIENIIEEELADEAIDEEKNSFIAGLINIYFPKVDGENLEFVIGRLSEYYTNYEFNEGSDKFLVVSVVSDELSLRELYERRLKGTDNEKRIKDVQDGYLKKLDSLKVLKKQGSKLDDGKNKFTMFVDELEKAGELKYNIPDISNDKIGELVQAINNSVIRAFSDG